MAIYHMYIGTYTNKGGVGIEHYRFDAETGGFSIQDKTNAPSPSYLTFSPDQTCLYAVLETGLYENRGGVAAYRIESDGSLSEIGRADAGGIAPCHLSVHPSGKTIYIANYVSGSLTTFSLNSDGSFGKRTIYQHIGKGVDPVRQEGPHAHYTALMPGGSILCVVDLGLDAILQYPIDQDGRIMGEPHCIPAPKGSGPRHLVFSSNGKFAYVVCELGNRILTYSVDGASMTLLDDQSTLPSGFTGRSACAAVRLSADGKNLYLTNRFHDSIAHYTVSPAGTLCLASLTPTGGKNPRDCTIAPEGRFLLCAHQDSDEVTILKIHAETGIPSLQPVSLACSMPVAVLFGSQTD